MNHVTTIVLVVTATQVVTLVFLLAVVLRRRHAPRLFSEPCSTIGVGALLGTADPTSAIIPRRVVQSWSSRDAVPQHIYSRIRQFAPGYEHIVFDDHDCTEFMRAHFPALLSLYSSLSKGAHRADLFRYCYLARYGGVWIDIKSTLEVPLDSILDDRTCIYTARSITNVSAGRTCFQGFLAAPPGTQFMLDLISSFAMIAVDMEERMKLSAGIGDAYLVFCRQMWRYIELHYHTARVGRNEPLVDGPTLVLLDEAERTICPTRRDRFGLCTYLNDESGRACLKVRDADFPFPSPTLAV